MIRSFYGRQGCGMSRCFVERYWWENRQYIYDNLADLPNECKECVTENEKEEEKNVKRETV